MGALTTERPGLTGPAAGTVDDRELDRAAHRPGRAIEPRPRPDGERPGAQPAEPSAQRRLRRDVLRVLVAANLLLATYYVSWRWVASINWHAWFIAVPLILAETYSYVDAWLFGLTIWRLREREPAPPPEAGATVDVFITTYDEPLELVMGTARAAREIAHPHRTYILDDGARPEMAEAAAAAGVGYITRSVEWRDRPRHAKAGNLNNALFQTEGEFILVLDADQVPDPAILDRTLGFFTDPEVALVQTPQYFVNVPEDDPLGSQAPLFYGPIQQGKDGWNAAFFCGSNAVLRREALMQIGVVGYVAETEAAARRVLRSGAKIIGRARRGARRQGDTAALTLLDGLDAALRQARSELDAGHSLQAVTHAFRRASRALSEGVVARDLENIRADLDALLSGAVDADADTGAILVDDAALAHLQTRELSPLAALTSVSRLIDGLDAVRTDEAQPVMPMATVSVTEDMATAMRLHGLGWRSVYHHEILARGLAPEDLRSAMAQRLRWAQGTLQVLLRENPLLQRRLSWGQRLMYFATMWSYLSGFTAVVYLLAPMLYLVGSVTPVQSFGGVFMWHLLPFLITNQLLFAAVSHGLPTWRGHQYSLALFPLWIRACTTAVGNVFFNRDLGFVVTPKTRQGGVSLKLVRVQVATMILLVLAAVIGLGRVILGDNPHGGAVMLNVGWIVYDLISLSVVIDAAYYRGFTTEEEQTHG